MGGVLSTKFPVFGNFPTWYWRFPNLQIRIGKFPEHEVYMDLAGCVTNVTCARAGAFMRAVIFNCIFYELVESFIKLQMQLRTD